jgi:dephospho-CoA kinase
VSSNPEIVEATSEEANREVSAESDTRPLAVFLVGPTCCGKTEAGRYLAGIGFTWLEPSEYIKKEIPLDVPILQRLRAVDDYFERVGRDYVARRLLSDSLLPDTLPPLVITGCRQPIEVALLQQDFKTVVVALQLDDTIRFSRSGNRARSDATLSFDTFVRATAWEYALGLADMIFRADHIVINNGTISDLYNELRSALHLAP